MSGITPKDVSTYSEMKKEQWEEIAVSFPPVYMNPTTHAAIVKEWLHRDSTYSIIINPLMFREPNIKRRTKNKIAKASRKKNRK